MAVDDDHRKTEHTQVPRRMGEGHLIPRRRSLPLRTRVALVGGVGALFVVGRFFGIPITDVAWAILAVVGLIILGRGGARL